MPRRPSRLVRHRAPARRREMPPHHRESSSPAGCRCRTEMPARRTLRAAGCATRPSCFLQAPRLPRGGAGVSNPQSAQGKAGPFCRELSSQARLRNRADPRRGSQAESRPPQFRKLRPTTRPLRQGRAAEALLASLAVAFRDWLPKSDLHAFLKPTALSLGERVARDGVFTSRRGPGEGSVARLNDHGPPYFSHELLGILQHQPARKSQQLNNDGSQLSLFNGIIHHLAWLGMNTTVQFDRQSTFETVEIDDMVFDSALAAEFHAQLSKCFAAGSASVSLRRSSRTRGIGMRMGTDYIMPGGRAGTNPSPVALRLKKTPAARHPLPKAKGGGCFSPGGLLIADS